MALSAAVTKIGETVLAQFDRLEAAVVDASSVIYMTKAGFFFDLARCVRLYAPPDVIGETGFSHIPVLAVSAPEGLSPDAQLLAWAARRRLPIVSEDKKVLMQAEALGLTYFNALLMLHFLLYKGKMSPEEHGTRYRNLRAVAWYSHRVYEIADNVLDYARAKSIQET